MKKLTTRWLSLVLATVLVLGSGAGTWDIVHAQEPDKSWVGGNVERDFPEEEGSEESEEPDSEEQPENGTDDSDKEGKGIEAKEEQQTEAEQTGKTLELAQLVITDGRLAAELLNEIEDLQEYSRKLREILTLYHRESLADSQYDTFVSALDHRASELLRAFEQAKAERETPALELGYLPGELVLHFEGMDQGEFTVLVENLGGTVKKIYQGLRGWASIELPLDFTTEKGIAVFGILEGIVSAERVHLLLREVEPPRQESARTAAMGSGLAPSPFTDPWTSAYNAYYQWHLEAMEVAKAWDLMEEVTNGQSREAIKVALLDTPVDESHSELAGNLKSSGYNPPSGLTASDAYHGTHAAGIIAAATNSSEGVGIATGRSNQAVELYTYNIYSSLGEDVAQTGLLYTTQGYIMDAVRHALGDGVRIVQIACDEIGFQEIWETFEQDAMNVIFVVPKQGTPYSGELTVIEVEPLKERDYREAQPQEYAESFGAPGVLVASTIPRTLSGVSPIQSDPIGEDDGKAASIAPSMATGTIALMLYVSPDMAPYTVRDALRDSTVDIGDGLGGINAYRAVYSASLMLPPRYVTVIPFSADNVEVRWMPTKGGAEIGILLNGFPESLDVGTNHYRLSALDYKKDYTVEVLQISAPWVKVGTNVVSFKTPDSNAPLATAKVELMEHAGGITVCWEPVEGADSYNVYRQSAIAEEDGNIIPTGEMELLENQTDVQFEDDNPGVNYSCIYYVESVSDSEGTGYFGVSRLAVQQDGFGTLDLVAQQVNSKEILLKWDAVPNAIGYEIYRKVGTVDDKLGETSRGVVSYLDDIGDSGLLGKVVTYRVEAVLLSGRMPSNAVTLTIEGMQDVARPEVREVYYDFVEISWEMTSGVDLYDVYLKVSGEENYTPVATGLNGNSFIIPGLAPGTTYFFCVSVAGSGVLSEPLEQATSALPVPAGLKAVEDGVEAGVVVLEWTHNAQEWQHGPDDWSIAVLRGTSLDEMEELTDVTISAGKVVDRTAERGETYYYALCYRLGEHIGGISNAVQVMVEELGAPNILLVSYGYRNVTITFDTVEGAASYRIYRCADGEDYSLVAHLDHVEGSQTLVGNDTSNLLPSTNYRYKLRAVDANGKEGNWSNEGAVKTGALLSPSGLGGSYDAAQKRILLTWNAVDETVQPNAIEVRRGSSASGPFSTVVANLTGESFNTADGNIALNTAYFYRVTYVYLIDGKRLETHSNVLRVYAGTESTGGNSGGGGGGGGGGARTTTSVAAAPKEVAFRELGKEEAQQIVKTYETASAKTGVTAYRVNLQNVGAVSAEAAEVFKNAKVTLTLVIDSMSDTTNTSVAVRVAGKPGLSTGAMNFSGSLVNARATTTKGLFSSWYQNKVQVVSLGQRTAFGQTVDLAVKLDFTGWKTDNLYFYAYNSDTNSFARIASPTYWFDDTGYIHFKSAHGGDIVISEGPLVRK